MIEMEVIKYSYKNGTSSRKLLILKAEKFYYKSSDTNCFCRPKAIEIKDVVGLMYGTKTITWGFKNILLARPELCISFISDNRTYDFQLLSSRDLFKLFHFAKDITSTATRRLGQPILSVSREFIDFVFTKCSERYPIRTRNYKDWFAKNITIPWNEYSKDVYLWKTITDSQLKIYNNSCCICIEDFEPLSQCVILDCNHIFHNECWRDFVSTPRRHHRCPLCNV